MNLGSYKMKAKKIIYETMIFHLDKDTKGFYHNYFKSNGEFSHQIFITDPYYDVTGRFEVDPKEYYGLTDNFLKRFRGIIE